MKNIILIVTLLFNLGIVFSQSSKTVRIGILSDKEQQDQKELGSQLKKEIQAVVGDAKVIFEKTLYNNFDPLLAQSNYKQLLTSNVDIILSFGVIDHFVIEQEKSYPKPVIIVGTINSDFVQLAEGQKTSDVDNLTYLIAPISYKKDLDTFSSLYDFENIGIVVDEYLPKIVPLTNFFDSYFNEKEASYRLLPVKNPGEVVSQLEGLDAIYLAGGFGTSGAEFQSLIDSINDKNIPSFSSFRRDDVEKGILATNQPETNIQQFFRRIALNVEAIVNGTNPKDLEVYVSYQDELSINYNTAKLIGFPLRYSMLGEANFIQGNTVIKSETTYSIIDVMKGVVSDNLSLNAEEKNIDLTEQDVKLAKSNYLPQVIAGVGGTYIDPEVAEISGGSNPEFSTAGNVSLNQTIYSEAANANITISKYRQKAQQETFNAIELDALLDASLTYFDALIAKTNANIQNQNLQLTKQNLNIAKQNFEAGESGKGDVLRFRSQMAQNTQVLVEASNALEQRFFAINQLMNNPINKEIDVEEATIEEGIFKNYNYDELKELLDDPKLRSDLVDFFVDEAKRNAPELKGIGFNIEANERNYRLNTTGRFVPTVALQGQYNLAISRSGKGSVRPAGVPVPPDGTYNAGIGITLPIFQQNQRNINRQTAIIQRDQLKLNKENIELNLDSSVHNLVLSMVNQIANIEISKIAEATAKESLDLIQNAYSEGAVPLIQLIDAQNNYLQAQITRATANYNYLLVFLQLERTIGYFFLMNTPESNQAFIQRAQAFILNRN